MSKLKRRNSYLTRRWFITAFIFLLLAVLSFIGGVILW